MTVSKLKITTMSNPKREAIDQFFDLEDTR